MGARRIRREQRRVDMAESRRRNGPRKAGERDRRRLRMIEIIKQGPLPYTPSVMSWLSAARQALAPHRPGRGGSTRQSSLAGPGPCPGR